MRLFSIISLFMTTCAALNGDPIIVGPDGDMSTPYTGSAGLLEAMDAAVQMGASSSTPIDISIKEGTYSPKNFNVPDGVNLIGLSGTINIETDYVMTVDATCQFSNIHFLPVSLPYAAFNVANSTVAFDNCSIGNLNASAGFCSITCSNSQVAIPGSTSGEAVFNLTSCSLIASLYTSTSPVTMNFSATTIPDGFSISCGETLQMNLSSCTCGNLSYSNNGSLTIEFTGCTVGTITKLNGNDAVIVYH